MWLHTMVKKYVEEKKPNNNEFKPKFKCPMKYGWIYGNNDKNLVSERNFMTSFWNYIMKISSSNPHSSSYVNYWVSKESSNQIKISIKNKVYESYLKSPDTTIFTLMNKYKISNIKFYPKSTDLIYDNKENITNSVPKKVLDEINELSKFNSFFNCDLISIECDFDTKYILVTFLINPVKFTSKSNRFLTNNQSFTNMINTFPNYEMYIKLIKIYSNSDEYIKSILMPLMFNHKFDKIDHKLIILNYNIFKEFISTANPDKLKMLKFYIIIYNLAFDDDDIYKPFFENHILSLLSEY